TDPETTLLHLLTIATGDAIPPSSREENPFDFWLNLLRMKLVQEPVLVVFDDLESTFDLKAEAGTFNDERWPQLFRAFIGTSSAVIVTSHQIPKFSDPATEFLSVPGISLEDSITLLHDAGLKDENDVFEEAHRFLQGHPMALRAMAAAVARRPRYRGFLSRAGDIMEAVRRCPDQTINPVAFFEGVIQPGHMSGTEYAIITAMPVLFRAEDEEAISALLPEMNLDDVAFALDELYLRSLVLADLDAEPPLFSLHPLVRNVAVQRLEDPKPFHERAYQYYCKLQWDEETKNPSDVEHLRQAVFQALALKDHKRVRSVLYDEIGLSSKLQGWGRFDLALPLHRREYELANEAGPDEDVMVAAGQFAKCLSRIGNIADALKKAEQALELAVKIGDKNKECEYRSQVGWILYSTGDYDESYKRLEEALKLAIETGNKANEGICRGLLGLILSRRGDFDNAFSQLAKALNIAIEFHDTTSEMDWRSTIGQNHFLRGSYDEALEQLRPAMDLAIEKGDQLHISKLGGLIGQVQTWKGDYDDALAALEKALKVDREIGNHRHEGGLLALKAFIYNYRGHFTEALELATNALEIAVEVGSKGGETYRIGLIGEIYLTMGEYEKAIGYFRKSCEYSIQIGSRTNECAWCGNLGYAYLCLGEYEKARKELEKALEIAIEMKDVVNEGEWLGKLGRLYLETGEKERAYGNLTKALEISLSVGKDPLSEKHHRDLLGKIELENGNPQQAVVHFKRVLEISKSLGMVDNIVQKAEARLNEARKLCV
ncbi:MAG: tetratricopeptide repeat protein, partial [bacterium]|nr:tetratricopeptide repeat protein [bacterium]